LFSPIEALLLRLNAETPYMHVPFLSFYLIWWVLYCWFLNWYLY